MLITVQHEVLKAYILTSLGYVVYQVTHKFRGCSNPREMFLLKVACLILFI